MMKRIIGTMTAIASAIIMLASVQVTAMAAPQAKDAQPPAQGAAPVQGEAPVPVKHLKSQRVKLLKKSLRMEKSL